MEHVCFLVRDAIERQLVADVPVCTFLSGGLDSSAISAIASDYFKKKAEERFIRIQSIMSVTVNTSNQFCFSRMKIDHGLIKWFMI